jgi:hypothetical protein
MPSSLFTAAGYWKQGKKPFYRLGGLLRKLCSEQKNTFVHLHKLNFSPAVLSTRGTSSGISRAASFRYIVVNPLFEGAHRGWQICARPIQSSHLNPLARANRDMVTTKQPCGTALHRPTVRAQVVQPTLVVSSVESPGFFDDSLR